MNKHIDVDPNPYEAALKLVKKNNGTSGQIGLAKSILSLYNPIHAFSISEILDNLDADYTEIVLMMVNNYAKNWETSELKVAGEYVYKKFPELVELSIAMQESRATVKNKWALQHEESLNRLYPNG